MSVCIGSHLGRYEILGLLGSGGMGEVYRARDTQLHREVALKLLPDEANGDAGAEARFEREARAIASVNHPNICAIYDVGVDAGRRFLVMELLHGETFQQRLVRAPFTIPEVLDHGMAVADALQTAHARDIIHRDLKPANIYLTTPGQVKILDFGLAKRPDATDAPTRAAEDAITGKGTAVGTAAYMSPEQIRGESLDVRTDLFSLGLVLYEMATGRRAFSGTTGAAVAASILNDQVARPFEVRAGVPAGLESVILKALEKERDFRYQSAADVKADLKRVKRQLSAEVALPDQKRVLPTTPVGAGTGTPQGGPPEHLSSSSDTQLLVAILSRRRVRASVAGAAIVVALASVAWLSVGNRPSGTTAGTLTDIQIQPLTLDGMVERGAISPDGRFLVYQPYGQGGVRVRQLSGETDIPIVATGRFSRIFSLTVTPDNDFVDIVAVTEQARVPDAWRVPLLGGNPRQILRNVASAIGWSPDGRKMAFVRVRDAGGETTVVVADADGANQQELASRRAPEAFYSHLTTSLGSPPSPPAWSPDGGTIVLAGYSTEKVWSTDFVFLETKTGATRRPFSMSGVWTEVTWLDEKRFLLVGTDTLGRQGASGVWVSDLDGRHLTPVTREFGFFMDLSVTADRATAVVKKFTRVSGIWTGGGSGSNAQLTVPMSPAGAALPSLDSRGGLTYTAFTASGVGAVYHLPQGSSTAVRVVDITPPPFAGRFYDVSSDGRTIVYTDAEPPNGMFKVRNDGSDRVRILETEALMPRLTPDGQTVLFVRRIPGLYSVPVAGGAVSKLSDRVIPLGNAARRTPFSVSPDGKRLLFNTDQPGVVVLCELPACSNPQDLRLPSVEWAPDGAGVAYLEGTTTIMEQRLDEAAPRQIAKLDGNEPIINFRWSPDGSRLATSRGTYPNDMVIIKGLRGGKRSFGE